MSQRSVIIVAGGSGTRMKQSLPKQFLVIAGKPVLAHTIQAFLDFDSDISIVLVLPENHFATWEQIERTFFPDVIIRKARGGHSRFQSVKAGLSIVSEGLVAIHDAVRPLISPEVIKQSFIKAEETGSGVVMVPMKDSIRRITDDKLTKSEDRSRFYLVQTPQTFRVEIIKEAFEQEELPLFTDDATVYESNGGHVTPVIGDYQNVKITTPEDLVVANAFLSQRLGN